MRQMSRGKKRANEPMRSFGQPSSLRGLLGGRGPGLALSWVLAGQLPNKGLRGGCLNSIQTVRTVGKEGIFTTVGNV